MKFSRIYLIILIPLLLSAQPYPNNFTQIWQDSTWAQGNLVPSGAVWSLNGIYDFDGDGNGEFLAGSSWSGSVGNDAMLFEWNGSDAPELIWYTWFNGMDSSAYNYSNIVKGDLDGDGVPEIIVLTDSYDNQDALFIYEYDTALNAFPFVPTVSWNLGISGGIEEASALQIKNIDSDPRPELIACVYSRNPADSHFIIAELADGHDLSNPAWNIELDNTSEMDYYSYLCQPTDLDRDGKSEILLVEWNYSRLIIFENTAEDSYSKVNDIFLTFEPLAFVNEGAAEANFDGDAYNELYLASTAGYVWVVTNSGDVSQITFANNFHLLKNYMTEGAYILSQLKIGNADSPAAATQDGPDVYIAGVDTNGVRSTLFDLEYTGGDVTDINSYQQTEIFSEYDSGGNIFKISKFAIGDLNGNGAREIVLGSFGLNANVSHFYVLESDLAAGMTPPATALIQNFQLQQNYPNPFNATTRIPFSLKKAGPVKLALYDISGRLVKILLDGWKEPGEYRISLDAGALSSGYYNYQLSVGNERTVKKMILIK